MDALELMFSEVLKYVNFLYVFICIVSTYAIITIIPKHISTWAKRIISTCVAIGLGMLFIFVWNADHLSILCSFFVQFLMYDYAIKGLLKKFSHKDDEKNDGKDDFEDTFGNDDFIAS